MIIGQERLLHRIDNLILRGEFPQTSVLIGESGSGRHTIAKYIADKLDCSIIDITDSVTLDTLTEIETNGLPYVYLIQADNISSKAQNILLKSLEEPPMFARFILICENVSYLLPTVLNRCFRFDIAPYTAEQLRPFCANEDVLKLANTIGQAKEYSEYDVVSAEKLATTILIKIRTANYANILNISNSIAYKSETDKFNFRFFIKVLLHIAKQLYVQKEITSSMFMCINELNKKCKVQNINKQYLFEGFLYRLKGVANDSD